jgi:peptidoglycan hydrolase FlgJ
MVAPADLSTKFALDVQAVNGLRIAGKTGQAGLEAAARQFEALFLGMMLKSMREATPRDSLMDSEQSRLYMSMLDQQLSQSMAARGVGLAEMMMRQLRDALPPEVQQPSHAADAGSPGGTVAVEAAMLSALPPGPPPDMPGHASSAEPAEWTQPGAPAPASPAAVQPELKLQPESQPQSQPKMPPQSHLQPQGWPSHVTEFRDRVMAYAQEASQATGIPARFVLGQAALESGWGRRELRAADGTPSHNLFGIKAGGNWRGRVVEATTTEYVNGVARKTVEQFRAYGSYADAFRDYANLLRSSPRYADLLAQAARGIDETGFAQGLQKAGYATDPGYADKLSRTIKTTPQS